MVGFMYIIGGITMKNFSRVLLSLLVLFTAVSFSSCKPARNVKNLQAHLVTKGYPAEKFMPVKNFAIKTALKIAGIKGITTYLDGNVAFVILQTKEPTRVEEIAALFGGIASSVDLSQVEGMGELAPLFQSFGSGSVDPADYVAVHENFTLIHSNNSPGLVEAFQSY